MAAALLAGGLASGTGCEEEEEAEDAAAAETEVSEAPAPPAAAPAGERPATAAEAPGQREAPLFRTQRRLMGTIFVISVVAPPDDPKARAAAEAAFDEIDRLEGLLSEWRPDSEISRINARAGEPAPVPISPDVRRVVETGLEVSRRSRGAFDLSWAALHGLYRFPPNPVRLPSEEELAERLPLVDHREVHLDPDVPSVRLGRDGMAIGTGGIAKGHALDRAGELLRAAGFDDFMLFGGGQVQVSGKKGSRPWRVGIQHPRRPADYFAFLEAEGGSISTSGDYEHFHVDEEGRRWHHLIDPRTGKPARGTTSVTMLAPRGVAADALSTACFIVGPEACLVMLAEHPARPEAVIVDDDLRLHTTPGTRDRLTFTMPIGPGGALPRPGARPEPGPAGNDPRQRY